MYPDTREDSKVKGPSARFMVTRSYDHEYSCITCTGGSNKQSIFNKENITVIIGTSQQVLLSQFSNKELYFKHLTNVEGFPEPVLQRTFFW